MNEQLEFLKQIAFRLESAGFEYMLTGSMAMAIYSVPRMTRDIDIVVECSPSNAEKITGLFASDCYIDEVVVRDAASRFSSFNIIHNNWIIKADFIILKNDEYRQVEFSRRIQVAVDDAEIYVVSPEDLILSKLIWMKMSQSDLQKSDISAMIEAVDNLDWNYLNQWIVQLGLNNIFEEHFKK